MYLPYYKNRFCGMVFLCIRFPKITLLAQIIIIDYHRYILVITMGHWEEWVMEPIRKSGSEAGTLLVIFLLIVLVLGQLVRGVVYLIENTMQRDKKLHCAFR